MESSDMELSSNFSGSASSNIRALGVPLPRRASFEIGGSSRGAAVFLGLAIVRCRDLPDRLRGKLAGCSAITAMTDFGPKATIDVRISMSGLRE